MSFRTLTAKHRATIAATAFLASAGIAAAQETDHLLLYQDLSSTQVLPIIEGFTAYYEKTTGKKIEIENFAQSGGQLQSTLVLEAKAGAVKADVIMTSPDGMTTIAKADPELLADYTPKALSDAAISPAAKAQSEVTPGTLFNVDPYVIVYNTDKVSGDAVPKNWKDILNPIYKNQIGMGDIEQTSGSRAPLWFIVKKMGDTLGWDYYKQLGALEPRLFDGHNALLDNIASGELTIGLAGYSTAYRAATTGAHVAAVLPSEGAGAQPTSVDIVKKDDVSPAAEMFVEWLLSKEGQEAAYRGTRALPVRSDVTLEEAPFPFETTSPKIEPLDPKWIADNRADNIAKFREAIGSF